MTQFVVNFAVSLIICSLVVSTADAGGKNSPAYLPDDASISCGSGAVYIADDSREWIGDADPRFTALLQIKGSSMISRGSDPVPYPYPYRTARISRSQFSYTYSLKPGPKLIRLHFDPTLHYKRFQDLFSVEVGNFVLLRHFSPSMAACALGVKSVVKEFFLSVEENERLEMVFSAERSRVKDAYAFINGIVITSVLPHLSFFGGGIKVVGQKSLAYIDNSTVMEIVRRVHLRRDSGEDDSGNTFGMKAEDEQRDGREINQMTWNVSVDLGFSYLVRLHYCEVGLTTAKIVSIKFTVLINKMFAASTDDVFKERGYSGIPLHGDHMVIVKGPKQRGKGDLSISLLLNSALLNAYGPFRGFEIVKLSNPDNSLASLSPLLLQPRYHPSRAWHSSLYVIWETNARIAIAITIMIIVNIIVHCLRKIQRAKPVVKERKPSARAAELYRCFRLTEIKAATRDFSPGRILGRGGCGVVYEGDIDNGQVTVAIKMLKCDSRQGECEFWTQIEILPVLRHVNVVSFIGYCCEQSLLVLVYEYMSGGTLADRLYKPDIDSSNRLSWQQRLNICIDAGRGLDYLHTGSGGVIHRDVKASNILLDSDLVAKIADFGLAKLDNMNDESQSHVSTNIRGTFGYLDPNYASTRHLTQKADMYSFGVVLLEVLCGRPAIDRRADEDKRSITAWARELMSKGEVHLMVDPSLREEIKPESLETYMKIVEGCLHDEPAQRPAMAAVVPRLMTALEVQKSATLPVAPTEIAAVAAEAPAAANNEHPTGTNDAGRADALRRAPQIARPWSIVNKIIRFKRKHTRRL